MKFHLIKQSGSQGKTESHTRITLNLAVSYSFFLLVILFMMVCLHNNSTKNTTANFKYQNESAFQSAIALLDNNFSIMEAYCRQLSLDSDFLHLARIADPEADYFYMSGMTIKNNMASKLYSYSELPVNSYFFYLRNTDYVVSVNGFSSEYLYHRGNYLYSAFPLEDWRTYIYADNQSGTMYPLYGLVPAGSDNGYLYLIDVNSLTYSNIPVTAGFHISYQKLKKIFSGVTLEDGGCILALDADGSLVFYLTEADTAAGCMENADPDALAEAVLALSFESNYAEMTCNGDDMHVTLCTSKTNDWQLYLIQPASLYTASYQDFFVFILILAFFVGLILVALLVRNSMAPIRQLDSELQKTITDRNHLKEALETTRPILYGTYLKQLMHGSITSPDEFAYIREFLHLEDPGLRYYVMYAIVYENEFVEHSGSITETVENMDEIVRQGLTEYFSYQNTLYLYAPKERVYAVLLPFDGATDSDEMLFSIQERVLKLHSELLEQYSIWFFTGIGLACPFTNIWESYQQAKDASGYTTKNYIFLPYEVLKKDSHVYYYPAEFSTRLIQFISTGSEEQVKEIFILIHHENIEQRSLPFHLLKFLLSDIRNTLLKARFAVTATAENQPLLEEIDALLTVENLTFRICEDIALKLCGLFQTKSEKSNQIDAIVEYIRANFKDPSLCLNKISDEFHISESYFSHMFKETMNINFSVYLEDMRLNEAARLIREGGYNLSEIALEVGYNNQTSFRRAFKKKFGVTPSAMANT